MYHESFIPSAQEFFFIQIAMCSGFFQSLGEIKTVLKNSLRLGVKLQYLIMAEGSEMTSGSRYHK